MITPEDYILGMSDLTGELMRYATNGESGTRPALSANVEIPAAVEVTPAGGYASPALVLVDSRRGTIRSGSGDNRPRPAAG